MDWKQWRLEFPITEHVTHFNHAGVSPVSRRVAAAVVAFINEATVIDAADLKKGVKSLVHTMWEYGVSLEWYLTSWLLFLLIYQVLLVTLGIYKPLTGITFLVWPLFISGVVFLKRDFDKATNALILLGLLYAILLAIGQLLG